MTESVSGSRTRLPAPTCVAIRFRARAMITNDEASGFWRSIPGMLTALAGTLAAIASLIAALSQAGLLGGSEGVAQPETTASQAADAAADVEGTWTGMVTYPWGLALEETLSIEVEQGRVSGSASYLGVPRALESAEVEGNRITFSTRAAEILGDEVTEYQNRYDGLVEGERIDFSLTDTRGEGPVRFTMRRQ